MLCWRGLGLVAPQIYPGCFGVLSMAKLKYVQKEQFTDTEEQGCTLVVICFYDSL